MYYTHARYEFTLNEQLVTAGAIFSAVRSGELVHLTQIMTKFPHTIVLTQEHARKMFAAPSKDLSAIIEGSVMASEAAYC